VRRQGPVPRGAYDVTVNVYRRAESIEYEGARLDHESEAARFPVGNGRRVGLHLRWSARPGAARHSGHSSAYRRVIYSLRSIRVGVLLPEVGAAAGEKGFRPQIASEGSTRGPGDYES
jgi:hypothetical protein